MFLRKHHSLNMQCPWLRKWDFTSCELPLVIAINLHWKLNCAISALKQREKVLTFRNAKPIQDQPAWSPKHATFLNFSFLIPGQTMRESLTSRVPWKKSHYNLYSDEYMEYNHFSKYPLVTFNASFMLDIHIWQTYAHTILKNRDDFSLLRGWYCQSRKRKLSP